MIGLFVTLLAILTPATSQDVDECSLGTHNCHVEANCINTYGGYICQCKDWFAGDGYDCRGFCNDSCSDIGRCREGVNGYTCFCRGSNCSSDDLPVIHDIQLLWRTHNSLFIAWTASNAFSVSAHIPGAGNEYSGTTQVGFIYLKSNTEHTMRLIARNFHSSVEKMFTAKTLPSPTYPAIPPVNTTDCDNCGENSHCNSTDAGFICICDECYVGNGFTCTQHCGGFPCFYSFDCFGYFVNFRLNFTELPVISNLRVTWTGSSGLSFAWNTSNVVYSNAYLVGDDTSYEQSFAEKAGFSFLKPSTTYKLIVVGYNTPGDSTTATIYQQTKPFVDHSTDSPTTLSDVCGIGFQLIGSDCVDINECSQGAHNCHQEAVCSNTHGSFICTCNLGYFGNGTICVGLCETSSVSFCGHGGYCYSNKYGTSCYQALDTSDPTVIITTEQAGTNYVSVSWKRINPSFVHHVYEVVLYTRDALKVKCNSLVDKEATFGNLIPNTVYTITVKALGFASDYSANLTFFTGSLSTTHDAITATTPLATEITSTFITTAEQTTSSRFTTSEPMATNEDFTTTEPSNCGENYDARKYREHFREWVQVFQKWKECSRPCEP